MNADEPLRPGDPVTLMLPDHTVMVEVDSSTRLDFMIKLSSRGEKSYLSRWRLDEEGIGWLRGYHLANSPEVAACRTAQALGTEKDAVTVTQAATVGIKNPPVPPGMGINGFGTSFISSGSSGNLNEEEIKKLFEKFMKDNHY